MQQSGFEHLPTPLLPCDMQLSVTVVVSIQNCTGKKSEILSTSLAVSEEGFLKQKGDTKRHLQKYYSEYIIP